MNPLDISAIVVTKGDRDITPVLASLCHFGEVIVWDNSKERDLKVAGRYLAVQKRALNATVYVQDDDTIVDTQTLCQLHAPSKITCNMPQRWHKSYEGTGISLVGFGAIFHQRDVDFSPYTNKWPEDELFLRECDRIFTYLNRVRCAWVEVAITQLDYSSAPDRMYVQRRTPRDYEEIRRRLAIL